MPSIQKVQWDSEARQLVLILPSRSTVDTCVLFSGREVKRVEYQGVETDVGAEHIWDSCNSASDLHPTPISGGFVEFHNASDEARRIVIRALHSGGVSCYMEHGPASLPFADAPEIRPNLASPGAESTTARYVVSHDDAIEIVIVVREDESEASRGASPLRAQTEAVVRSLLRAKVGGDTGRMELTLRAVA
ncbi:MAG TPA: hypothetical protein VNA88_04740 [Candidatus Kapabacteria bacterium]|nr:hypothetical protein [Candidatus Kapabacteria bacterium]